jgi:hypothetical protein
VIVYVAAGVATAAMLSEVALMFAGRVSWWYLIAVVPTVALAARIAASERGAPTAGHRGRLAAAVTVVVAAALVVVVTVHVLPGFSLLLVILLPTCVVRSRRRVGVRHRRNTRLPPLPN